MENIYVIIAAGIGTIFLLWLLFYFVPVGLWFTALVSDVRISLLQLILMRWRKVPPSVIVNNMIAATKAGLHLQRDELEAHYWQADMFKKWLMHSFLPTRQILS